MRLHLCAIWSLSSLCVFLPIVHLQLFSQGTDPLQVQPHLVRCFDGIASLRFEEMESRSPSRRSGKRRSSRGREIPSRLSGQSSPVSTEDKRRRSWGQVVRRYSEDGGGGGGGGGGGDSPTHEEGKLSFGQASLALMFSATMRKDKEARPLEVVSMLAGSGEEVRLVSPVSPHMYAYRLEQWMLQLEAVMKLTVKDQLFKCIRDDRRAALVEWIKVGCVCRHKCERMCVLMTVRVDVCVCVCVAQVYLVRKGPCICYPFPFPLPSFLRPGPPCVSSPPSKCCGRRMWRRHWCRAGVAPPRCPTPPPRRPPPHPQATSTASAPAPFV